MRGLPGPGGRRRRRTRRVPALLGDELDGAAGARTFVFGGTPAVSLDPSQASVSPSGQSTNVSSKLGIDATRKHPYMPHSGAPAAHLAQVDARWAEYGLE